MDKLKCSSVATYKSKVIQMCCFAGKSVIISWLKTMVGTFFVPDI